LSDFQKRLDSASIINEDDDLEQSSLRPHDIEMDFEDEKMEDYNRYQN
jgi:hypothetical protein